VNAAQLARAHHRRQAALARRISQEADRLWSQVDLARLDATWGAIGPRLVAVVAGGQLLAAASSDGFVDEAIAAQGIIAPPAAKLVAPALAGVASDGRSLATLLYEPVIGVKTAIQSGLDPAAAYAGGRINLDMIVRTQVADAGRVATGVAITTRPHVAGYIRVLSPPSCARCAILAGRHYAWSAGFQRHPRCDCVNVPAQDAGDAVDPRKYFDSLSHADQDKHFGKAGAEAIRDGADMGQVVNARRGMSTAGGRAYTTESTTRSGRVHHARIMPEQIYKDAAGDRDKAIRLLQHHGYLTGQPATRVGTPPLPAARSPRAVLRKTVKDAKVAERAGTLKWDRLYGGVSAQTRVAILPDGRKLVHKAAGSWEAAEDARGYADAEHLASLLGHALEIPVPAVIKDGAAAVWMEFAPGETIGKLEDLGRLDEYLRLLDSPQGHRLGLFDALIGNADRNAGNLIVGPDGRLRPIDHGFAWGYPASPDQLGGMFTDRPLQYFVRRSEPRNEWIGNPLTHADVAEVRRRLEELRPQFVRLGRGDWLDRSLDALDQVAQHATGTESILADLASGDTHR
jgi:hypothetical protein